jgi:hypothetical protein
MQHDPTVADSAGHTMIDIEAATRPADCPHPSPAISEPVPQAKASPEREARSDER